LPCLLLGIGYCIYATSLWPGIAYTVDKRLLGSAYGITTAIQNIGMGLGPFIVSFAHDHTQGFKHGFFAVSLVNA